MYNIGNKSFDLLGNSLCELCFRFSFYHDLFVYVKKSIITSGALRLMAMKNETAETVAVIGTS